MAKARLLLLLLLHFFSLSQKSIKIMTELCFPSLVSAEKFFFFKIHFLVLDLKVQQAKKSPACYCMSPEAAETVKVGAAAAAALVFTTRSNFICRSQFWHFHWNVPRGMFGVTFRMVCDALYGPSATTVPQLAPQFCTCPVLFSRKRILCNFAPISHFGCISAQNYFSAHTTAQLCTCCAQKAQCTTVFMALPLSCEQSSEYLCKWSCTCA